MKSAIIYCSKTGNTEKVAASIQRGLGGESDMIKLDLTTEGVLKDFSDIFTFDVAPYDLIFFGSWTMIMRVHPFLSAYINQCENLEGKNIAGFITGGAIFSKGHVYDDFKKIVESSGANFIDILYLTTLLGPALTRKKLRNAEIFASSIASRIIL